MRGCSRSMRLLAVLVLLVGCASSKPPSGAANFGVDPKDPLAGTLLMQQGQALVSEGKFSEGMARYWVALKIQPKNPTIHNLLGVALLRSGDAAKAVASFNQTLALAPQYSDARNNRGAAYVQLGQFANAEADFLAVLGDQTHANRTSVYFNLGSLYLARGDLSAAEENLRRAAVASGPVEAYGMLGQVEEKLSKPAQAEAAYREAIAKAPERADLMLALGKLLAGSGRKDEARDLFRRVVAVAPGSTEARQAHALME